MSETNGLFPRIVLSGSLGAGRIIAGDYVLRITDIENGHRLTVSKGNDVQTMDVLNGETGAPGPAGQDGQPGQPGQPGQDGQDGQDGVSPIVDVDEITGGHRVTITDAEGEHQFDVMNGATGATGPQGPAGQDAVVDATLTQAGQAADAKATGDEIDEIKDALDGLSFVRLTQEEYDLMASHDANTLYIIVAGDAS